MRHTIEALLFSCHLIHLGKFLRVQALSEVHVAGLADALRTVLAVLAGRVHGAVIHVAAVVDLALGTFQLAWRRRVDVRLDTFASKSVNSFVTKNRFQ